MKLTVTINFGQVLFVLMAVPVFFVVVLPPLILVGAIYGIGSAFIFIFTEFFPQGWRAWTRWGEEE